MDPTVFILKEEAPKFLVCVYIDDIIIVSPSETEIQCLLTTIGREFPIRDLGDLRYFLGIQVSQVQARLHLTQTQYLVNLLRSLDMENLKPVVTPMVLKVDLHAQGSLLSNPHEYRRIIGYLQYLTLTRLDNHFVVNFLS